MAFFAVFADPKGKAGLESPLLLTPVSGLGFFESSEERISDRRRRRLMLGQKMRDSGRGNFMMRNSSTSELVVESVVFDVTGWFRLSLKDDGGTLAGGVSPKVLRQGSKDSFTIYFSNI